MHRIDTSTAQVDKFGVGKNGFTGGNPQTGELPTALDQYFFDSVQEELCSVIEEAGNPLNKSLRNQLITALKKMFLQAGNNLSDIETPSLALSNLGGAPVVSPVLSGTPKVPTAAAGTNNDQMASTAFVQTAVSGAAGRLLNVQVFNSSATYTPTAGTKMIYVEVVGAGGAGAGSILTSAATLSGGAGGGGGGYASSLLTTVPSSAAVVIGVGGIGVTNDGGTAASGGSSSFNSVITATGGNGGGGTGGSVASSSTASQNGGGDGGLGSGGNLVNSKGGVGGRSFFTTVNSSLAGDGGDSRFSFGPRAIGGTFGAGTNGLYGAGGAGALSQGGSAAQKGGNGGNGCVIVKEYS